MKAFSIKRHITAARQKEVMRLLAEAYPMPMTAEQIACEVGISASHAHSVLFAMKEAGRVVKCDKAIYGSARIRI